MFGDDKKNMHPDDMRNLFIFFVIAVVLYLAYDTFVQQPHRVAMAQARQAAAQNQVESVIDDLAKSIPPEDVKPRAEVIANDQRIKIDNPAIRGSIALRGARLDDIALKEYFLTLEKKENVAVLSPRGTEFPRYIEHGWATADKAMRVPGPDTSWQLRGGVTLTDQSPVTLFWNNGQGLEFERRISIDKSYMLQITQTVTNTTSREVSLSPYGMTVQRSLPKDLVINWLQHEGPVGYAGKLHEVKYGDLYKKGTESFSADTGWTGIMEKYWMAAVIPPQGQSTKYDYSYNGATPAKGQRPQGLFQSDYTVAPMTIAPGASASSTSHVFVGPKKVMVLDEYEKALNIPHLDLAVNFGWFWFFSRPFFLALHYLAEFTGNFGVAIILLTIVARMAVFPLTNASYRSFAKMKMVTPQIAQLRAAHGDDRAGLQKAITELYQREGVNPMAGCVPILIQIPIFFALYKVLFVTIEMRHAPFFGWIHDLSAPDPTSIFNLFGLIDWDPPRVLHIGVWPCVMLISMLIQKKLNPPPQDPIQRDMANYFPFLITYFVSRLASGMVIYWSISGIIGLIQQIVIMRSLGVPIHLFGQTEEEKQMEKAVDKGPAVHPLVEMAEEKVEGALFGDEGPSKTISPPKPKKKKKK